MSSSTPAEHSDFSLHRTVPELEAVQTRFENFLRKKGLRVSEQRIQLLRIVFSSHDHFTADTLHRFCQEEALGISKATVYRTLGVLEECGLIEGIDFGHGYRHYEHVYGHLHHDHGFCVRCGKIFEFENEDIERLQLEICKSLGLQPVSHSLRIFGVCEACRLGDGREAKDGGQQQGAG